MNKNYCANCEAELTEENTKDYGGFDANGYKVANSLVWVSKDWFYHCDECSDKIIDNFLDSLYS